MWNMTGDRALICSVECLAHTSPHVGASLGLPATLISPPRMSLQPPPPPSSSSLPPHAPLPPLLRGSPECCTFYQASAAWRRRAQSDGTQRRCLWRIILFIAFVRQALQIFVSLSPTYCRSLSQYWCSSFVRSCSFYSANWVAAEGWKQSFKNSTEDVNLSFWFRCPFPLLLVQKT